MRRRLSFLLALTLLASCVTMEKTPAVAEVVAVTPVTAIPDLPNRLIDVVPITGYDDTYATLDQLTVEGSNSVACLTDGMFASRELNAAGTGYIHDGRWMGDATKGAVQIWDLGNACEVSQLLIGSEAAPAQYVDAVRVYVGDDKTSLLQSTYLVADISGLTAQNNLLTLPQTATGRYVGFDFSVCSASGARIFNMRLGELGVYGELVDKITPYSQSVVGANLTLPADNLLRDAVAEYRSGTQGTAQISSLLTTVLTDGQYSHDNSAKMCPVGEYVYFCYDLGVSHTITALTYAGDYNDGAASVAVYVGEDAPSVFLQQGRYNALYEDSYIGISVRVPTAQNKGVSAVRFDFAQPLVGRYVVFRLQGYANDDNRQAWVSEFSAEGSEVLRVFQSQGAQLRGYLEGVPTEEVAVRFGTTLSVAGVTTDAQNNTILSASSCMMVNGKTYPVVQFGTLVARADLLRDTPLEWEQVGDVVKAVPAHKLYSSTADSVTYTAVVTGIRVEYYDTPLVVRGYVQYRDGSTLRCAYGEIVRRSTSDVIRQVAPTAQNKLVALTFDDGPASATTERLLDALKKRGVRATFFLKGSNITTETAYLVERMAAEGHAIGNHTENHQHLTAMTYDEMKAEVDTCATKIEKIIGYEPRILRCPGGWINDDVKRFSAAEGLTLVNWSLDTDDWSSRNAQAILQKAFDTENGIRDGSIVLMHDTYSSTVDAAIEMVDRLLDQGYALVTVPQLLELRCGGGTAGTVYTAAYPQ